MLNGGKPMSNFWNAAVGGVAGGLITAVILIIASKWWMRIFLPWFEHIIKKGVRIDGMWKTYMDINGIEKTEVARLIQKGYRITGTITYPKDTKGRSHTYEIMGEFYDNVFSALMVEVGKSKLDRGAILLTLKPGTSCPEMNGIGIWFDGEKPYTSQYKWTLERD